MSAIKITNLTKTYANGFQALKGIDLTVEEGDFFALLGPNGAGKSTCIGIIASLVNKTSGLVEICGHNIETDLIQAKKQLGIVPQEFNFNIFEPIEEIIINQAGYYGVDKETATKRTEIFLKELGLWAFRGSQARQLSGGMKRRLMIARALVHQPRVLILDEPTAGVDIELRRSMWKFMKEINEQGTTIILTTHYLEEAEQMCKNIAIIDEGKILHNTSMKSLLSSLDCEAFILDLEQPLQKAPVLKDVPSYQLIDSTTLEINIPKTYSLSQVFNQLSAHNINVKSMRNKVNRLEELFVSIINKKS
ncbi:MAG: ABC transporter ATP-binding protein [Gammaproteobacteria bacterium]|nr:ABC transporter ATP-binding protein [Gammaproteobacteria bacterium]